MRLLGTGDTGHRFNRVVQRRLVFDVGGRLRVNLRLKRGIQTGLCVLAVAQRLRHVIDAGVGIIHFRGQCRLLLRLGGDFPFGIRYASRQTAYGTRRRVRGILCRFRIGNIRDNQIVDIQRITGGAAAGGATGGDPDHRACSARPVVTGDTRKFHPFIARAQRGFADSDRRLPGILPGSILRLDTDQRRPPGGGRLIRRHHGPELKPELRVLTD